ncbi:MAG: hydroxymethylglutaryl-CoA reductase, degradative [Bdellovibrionales bacterium]
MSDVTSTGINSTKINLSGFAKLNRIERIQKLEELGLLEGDDVDLLMRERTLDPILAESFIENVIGYFQIPLGVATNFRIDQKDYVIPMAVEETSIIAAASATAKWVRDHGEVTTDVSGKNVIGQIQIGRCKDLITTKKIIEENKKMLLREANFVAEGLVRRGGGVKDLEIRIVPRSDQTTNLENLLPENSMMVIHVHADARDAMGANILNQVCEALKNPIQDLTGEKVTMCILSNLVDTKLTRAEVRIFGIEPELAERIEEASLFAWQDPYRAATNNKGILNGIDAMVVATGNDWRAVEAGMHAYAVKEGRYRTLSRWKREGDDLVGIMEAPIVVGTVGGVTRLHPMARMSLKLMGITSAEHLSRLMAAVGLVQNLGALKALSTVGIVQGHMRLHTTNLALAAGAAKEEIPDIRRELEALLLKNRRISHSQAVEVLEKYRRSHVSTLSP